MRATATCFFIRPLCVLLATNRPPWYSYRMNTRENYLAGLKKAIPVALAYLAVSFTFGLAARRNTFPLWFASLISATNLTSAGQFTGIELLRLGAGYLELSLAVFIINLRYALMSFSLSQQVKIRITPGTRFAMSLFLTDEVFALANEKGSAITPAYYFGLSTLPYLGWQLGTLAGYLSGGLFPKSVIAAAGIAIYCMYIAIFLPPMKKHKGIALAVLAGAAISCGLYYIPYLNKIPMGFRVIIAAIAATAAAAAIFPHKDEPEPKPLEQEEEEK